MITQQAKIRNKAGIHVRPSGILVAAAEEYEGAITLKAKGMDTDLKNVIGLLAMGLVYGDTVDVSVTGPRAESTCAKFVELLETEFDFPPRQ